ncbi:MAG: AAA family ATPase [Patescibacteria group bacterium]
MVRKEIITINGVPGAGKSSTADLVARELGYDRFSSGDFMRKIALERGVTLNKLSEMAEKDTSIDQAIDEEVKKLRNRGGTVIDSRLAFHWIPESFKVFLDLPLNISKERIFKDFEENKLRQASEKRAGTSEEVYEKITKRLESERKRYRELYSIEDHTDKKNYDLVVDTNKNNLEGVARIIVRSYREWLTER